MGRLNQLNGHVMEPRELILEGDLEQMGGVDAQAGCTCHYCHQNRAYFALLFEPLLAPGTS